MSDELARIKIISDGLTRDGHIQVLTEDGTDITHAISEIDIRMRVNEVNTATIKALLVGTEIDAVITDLQTQVLPPPQPKPQYRFRIFDSPNAIPDFPEPVLRLWELHKLTPLPTYGVKEEFLAGGTCPDAPLVEIVQDVEE